MRRVRRILLPLLSAALGSAAALLVLEGSFRVLGICAGATRGGSSGSRTDRTCSSPGRAGHVVIDLYVSNPRGAVTLDLRDEGTRNDLVRRKVARVDEARATHPLRRAVRLQLPRLPRARAVPEAGGRAPDRVRGRLVRGGAGRRRRAPRAVRLVERALRRGDPAAEVWNLGVRGHDFPELEGVFEEALALKPDVLRLRDGPERRRARPVPDEEPAAGERLDHGPAADAVVARTASVPDLVRPVGATRRCRSRATRRPGTGRSTRTRTRRAGRGRGHLAADQGALRGREGVAFGVALWPLLVGLDDGAALPVRGRPRPDPPGCRASAQIPFVDLLPALRGRPTASLWVHESDLHPNEVAQEAGGARADAVRPGPRERGIGGGGLPAAAGPGRQGGVHDPQPSRLSGAAAWLAVARAARRHLRPAVRPGGPAGAARPRPR